MDKEIKLQFASTLESLQGTTRRVDDLAAALLALRLTLAELGPNFEALYAKHYAGPEVQQAIRSCAAERELLAAAIELLRRSA